MPAFRLLFVCAGNVCRSPVGERLLRPLLPADGFTVHSAGLVALAGAEMSPRAAAQLERLGGDPGGFRARQLDGDMVASADLVLVATAELRSQLLAEWPQALRRTFTVREFAALLDVLEGDPAEESGSLAELVDAAQARRSEVRALDLDIPDPFRRDDEAHRTAADLMHTAVVRIAKGLGGCWVEPGEA